MLTKLFFLSLSLSLSLNLFAQGKVGINTTTPAAMLHVKDSSVVFTGPNPLPNMPGNPPISGPGTRMMWYPNKAAFRAGVALGQQWNKDSIGLYSLALGYNTRAFGGSSVAIGNLIKADGDFSVALGANNITTGQQSSALGSFLTTTGTWSTAIGVNNTSTGNASIAMGSGTRASGYNATTTGVQTVANSLHMFATGVLNDTVAGVLPFNSSGEDQLFVVGNGSFLGRSNALTVLRNGKTGIGTVNPQNKLHVSSGLSGATAASTAVGIFEDNSDVSINLITPDSDESSIYFGNPSNALHGGIVYNSNVANGLEFRTNGNITQAVINDVGNFGIGDNSPNSKLHVSRGLSGAVYNGTAAMIIEDDASSYLQFANPSGNEAGLLSATNLINIRGGLIFRPDSSLHLRSGGNSTRVAISANGNTGIGTQFPQRLLHVSAGTSGASPASSSIVVFEDNADAIINLLTPAANESGLYFGNPANSAHGGIVYNSTVANGLAFRTNGNTTRAVINSTGDMGIGDDSPNARMHVSNGAGGAMYQSESDLIIEDNNNAYIQFSSPNSFASGLISGNSVTDIRSALLFLGDSSLLLRAGGNTTRLAINKSGNVGIGTSIPSEKLHVVGDICYTGAIGACSDVRYKKDFVPLQNSLSKILSIGAYSYYWNTEKFDSLAFTDEKQIGVIAQEVQKVFPEVVMTNDQGYLSVDYSRLSVLLIAAMQEQQNMIDEQNKRLDTQQAQIDFLMKEISKSTASSE